MTDLNISGDGSGAIAACQAAQAAIDAIQGKTVTIDFERLPGESDDEYRARFEQWKRELRGETDESGER